MMTDEWGATGEQSRTAKLTEDRVRDIKRALKRGETYRTIAARFGVSIGAIYRIKTGASWSHVRVDRGEQ